MRKIKEIFAILDKKSRKKMLFILILAAFSAVIDSLGAASVMPFIAFILNPGYTVENETSSAILSALNIAPEEISATHAGLIFFSIYTFSLVIKAITAFSVIKFIINQECKIGVKITQNYLSQEYEWFLPRHSADLGKTILSEVKEYTDNALMPAMVFITQSLVVIAIFMTLLIIEPKVAIIVIGGLSTLLFVVVKILGRNLSKIGEKRFAENEKRFKTINEIFTSIKEIKFRTAEKNVVEKFIATASDYATLQARAQVTAQVPRFLMEGIAFGGILLVLAISLQGGFQVAVPLIALYALAGYKLMPAIQQIYISSSKIKYSGHAVEKLGESVYLPCENVSKYAKEIKFDKNLILKNIRYKYPNSKTYALDKINLEIKKGEKIALVGISGSGKSTILDIVLGLLASYEGEVRIDNEVLTIDKLSSWKSIVGYVPQQIQIFADTIKNNIIAGEIFDQDKFDETLKVSQLVEFVNNLPEGIETWLTEKGGNLSGGQKQRIAIARAIYRQPHILVMDEPTSALDESTESKIIQSIFSDKRLTILMIAHRIQAINAADRVIEVVKSKIAESASI